MILATHNSLSSYAPKKWWMKMLNPFARCQSLSIEEQYKRGVRMFDIRVRPHTWEASHGLVRYDISVPSALRWLDAQKDVVVRLCCEDLRISNYNDGYELRWFVDYFEQCEQTYRNIKFCGGYMKSGWTKVINVRDPEYLELYRTFNAYKSQRGWKAKLKSIVEYIKHPMPEYWARKDNARYLDENENYNGYLMLDFIEYDTEDK